jgi:predicted secreted protein
MPRTSLLLNLAVAAGLLLGAGCSLSPSQPKTWTTIALKPAERSVAAKLKIGQGIRVILPRPQGGADFTWQIVSNSVDVLEQLTPLYPTKGAPEPGPDGEVTVSFSAIDEGKSLLRFAALRPSAEFSEPTDYYEITVTVRP